MAEPDMPNAPMPARGLSVAAALLVPGMIAATVIFYLVAPGPFLDIVITAHEWREGDMLRERQLIEIVTVVSGLLGFMLMTPVAWRLWRRGGRLLRPAAVAITLIAAATFFFVGEEMSWGQWLFGWEARGMAEISGARETNLHNIDLPISIQSLGSVFLIVAFIVLPALWYFRDQTKLSARWLPAVAELPVVIAIVCAFVWKEVKSLYRLLTPDGEESRFYREFIEQIPEHKEMLIAVSLMLYGLYRLRWWNVAAEPR